MVDGKGWRSGALIEKKYLSQWYLKITKYADDLLEGFQDLSGWPSSVVDMQRKWIGKSHGIEINLKVNDNRIDDIIVFTTKPETIFGVEFIMIGPNHKISQKLSAESKEIEDFVSKCNNSSDTDLLCYRTSITCNNPLNGFCYNSN